MKLQAAPSQLRVEFAGVAQLTQFDPHAVTSVSLAQPLPQRWKPLLHVKSQLVPLHVAVAFAGAEQSTQLGPQAFASFARHVPSQFRIPGGHADEHTPLEHIREPPAGAVQRVQPMPHASTSLLLAHLSPHRLNPALHAQSHAPASHETCEFVGADVGRVHGAHLVPHELTSLFDRQLLPHSCVPLGHAAHMPFLQARPSQLLSHVPQCNESVIRFTHDSPHAVEFAMQSHVPNPHVGPHVRILLAPHSSVSPGVHSP